MKRCLLLLLLPLLFFSSCEEAVEQAQEDALVSLIVNGQWVVTKYIKGGTDVTADFALYRFQFQRNEKVDAIKNGSVEKTGTWLGNAAARTITSEFSNANATLTLLNGTFTITDSGLTYVEASQTVGGEVRSLRLDKR